MTITTILNLTHHSIIMRIIIVHHFNPQKSPKIFESSNFESVTKINSVMYSILFDISAVTSTGLRGRWFNFRTTSHICWFDFWKSMAQFFPVSDNICHSWEQMNERQWDLGNKEDCVAGLSMEEKRMHVAAMEERLQCKVEGLLGLLFQTWQNSFARADFFGGIIYRQWSGTVL